MGRYFLIPLLLAPPSCGTVAAEPQPAVETAPLIARGEPLDTGIFARLAEKIIPSVVNISTLITLKSPLLEGLPPDEFFRRFFDEFFGPPSSPNFDDGDDPAPGTPGDATRPKERHSDGRQSRDPAGIRYSPHDPRDPHGPRRMPHAVALGTGFVLTSDGVILTNNHVVANADEIKVAFTEATQEVPADAVVVGRDAELDVALIRLKKKPPTRLVPVRMGDSDQVAIGQFVMAVGNPFGQGHTVTHGIISQKGRAAPGIPLASYLQTDAPINPGNSGGPLVNLVGEVIGINNAIEARAQGIGFAIPINPVKAILPELERKGTVTRGYLGVVVEELSPEVARKLGAPPDLHAPLVVQVYENGPAAKAGIQPYDIITDYDNKRVQSGSQLTSDVTASKIGRPSEVRVLRNGDTRTLSVTPAERPVSRDLAGEIPPARKHREPVPPPGQEKERKIDPGMTLETMTRDLASEMGLPKSTAGVVVTSVQPGSRASYAGLVAGDIILEVDRKAVRSVPDFNRIVKERGEYLLRVRRPNPTGNDVYLAAVLDLS